jgi:hypothetical protein
MLPDFLLIGTQKGGTTSLYDQLCEHRLVLTPVRKEVHYFTHNAARPERWYRSHFPPMPKHAPDGQRPLTGEATPYYLFHPGVPAKAHKLLPDARLIVMLRDPVERACSHHNHELALGFETLPLADALAAEEERLAGEAERLAADATGTSYAHQHFSYVARGRYAEQLERWLAHYPREQLMILVSEDFFADPVAATLRVQRFLGLQEQLPRNVAPRNARRHALLAGRQRRHLAAIFAADNQRLSSLLGRDLPWS